MQARSLQRSLLAPTHPTRSHREQAVVNPTAWEQQIQIPRGWTYRACTGRLVELSGSHAAPLLTLAMGLVLDAQRAGEPVAWIQRSASTFFPPDVARNGVDLASLVVLRIPEALPVVGRIHRAPSSVPSEYESTDAAGPAVSMSEREARRQVFQSQHALARAAGRLLRSGAFGLVVLDLESERGIPPALLGKLGQLAQRHDTAVCCLTLKGPDRPSLGSFVSLRGEAVRQRTGVDRFSCVLRVLKDKRNGPGWTHEEVAHGAPGLS